MPLFLLKIWQNIIYYIEKYRPTLFIYHYLEEKKEEKEVKKNT